jgi:hypothetical protein
VADIGNERIREINTSGIINTIAGTGAYGFSGDGNPATGAEFEDPAGICGDKSGNIYVADEFNNKVREINSSGIISTIAGSSARGYSGDGGAATLAELYYPSGVAVDSIGEIFISDESNNCIRMVYSNGNITTIAGNGIAGFAGDGGSALLSELSNPAGVGVDNKGNIYIADGFNSRIRKIGRDGVISTIAGNGIPGYTGVGDTATVVSLYNPVSVFADDFGNIYLANEFNNFVQKLTPLPAKELFLSSVTIYPNPNQGVFTIAIQNFQASLKLEVYNVLGERVLYLELTSPETQLNLSAYSKGVYLYRVVSANNENFATGKIVII